VTTEAPRQGIDLYWLPLGAGGHFVRINGRVYEAIHAWRQHRAPLDLYHTALEVTVSEGRFVIENAWPIPDANSLSRGTTVEGPVWSHWLGQFRVLRYEVRRWRHGTIPDIAFAVSSPQRVSDDEEQARRVLALTATVPPYIWGRDEFHLGEMWNSNSVIAWLLTRAGVAVDTILPPSGGRAPGWSTGVAVAQRMTPMSRGHNVGSS
jgi:hypothetical protein